MATNVSIKEVPDELLERIKQRAEKNHRSLQGELLVILEESVSGGPSLSPAEALRAVGQLDWNSGSDSVAFIRKLRDAK